MAAGGVPNARQDQQATTIPTRQRGCLESGAFRSNRYRGLADNGTAAGDSELNPAALPPTAVRMWSDHGRIDL